MFYVLGASKMVPPEVSAVPSAIVSVGVPKFFRLSFKGFPFNKKSKQDDGALLANSTASFRVSKFFPFSSVFVSQWYTAQWYDGYSPVYGSGLWSGQAVGMVLDTFQVSE